MDKETIEKFDLRQFVKSWLLPLAAEIAILLVIFNFVINITYVPTGSMIPTISGNIAAVTLGSTSLRRALTVSRAITLPPMAAWIGTSNICRGMCSLSFSTMALARG